MPLLETADAMLDYRAYGSGAPVTVFGHGLGGSVAATRPLASGVGGTRVLLHFRGHGPSVAGGPDPARDAGWDYAALAGDLAAVADAVGATRALGVSMGGGALLRLLADDPDRFERLVFFLPSALDEPRGDAAVRQLAETAAAVQSGDRPALLRLLRDELPAAVRDLPEATAYTAARADALAGGGAPAGGGAVRLLRELPFAAPLADRSVLAAVGAPALVLAQLDDPLHPVSAARELAAALPTARLHVLPPGAVWTARDRLRELVAGWLSG